MIYNNCMNFKINAVDIYGTGVAAILLNMISLDPEGSCF